MRIFALVGAAAAGFVLLVPAGSIQAADRSTETILAEIAQGSRAHRARIRSGHGQAQVRFIRHYAAVRRPQLPGGAVLLEDTQGAAPVSPRAVRATEGPRPTTPTAGPPARGGSQIVRTADVTFVFKGNRLRWDEDNVAVRDGDNVRPGVATRRALIGDTLIEYVPDTRRATTRTLPDLPYGARRSVQPFEPLYYGIEFFGQPLEELLHEAGDRTSVTTETAEGRDLYVLTIAPVGNENRRRRLWIDPARGYTVQKYEAVDPEGFVSIAMTCHFQMRAGDLWVPSIVDHKTFDPNTRQPLTERHIAFRSFTPNAEVKDRVFTLAGMGAMKKTRRYSPGGYYR